MPETDLPETGDLLPPPASPLSILKQAIKKVPALKYALGIVGLAASLAVIRTLVTDLRLAIFGIVFLLVLMTVLFVFAKLTSVASKELKAPAFVLLWFSLILTMIAASLLFTSVFFNWPINLTHVLDGRSGVLEESSTKQNVQPKTTYLKGVIRDSSTKEGLANATIEVEVLPGERFATTTDGGFSIDRIPGMSGESARVYVAKDGYARKDEFVTLPGPKTIFLEKLPPPSPAPTKTPTQKNNQNSNQEIDRLLNRRPSNRPNE